MQQVSQFLHLSIIHVIINTIHIIRKSQTSFSTTTSLKFFIVGIVVVRNYKTKTLKLTKGESPLIKSEKTASSKRAPK